jgi:hypothetical protein
MNSVTDEQKFLENYRKRIIRETLKKLYKNYKIYDSEGVLMDIDKIQKEIFSPKIIQRCVGATNTTPISQCTRNAIENYDYCRTHLYKICLDSKEIKAQDTPVIFNLNTKSKYNNDDSTYKDDLKSKFIDDSFYFVDNKFIYDTNYNKVGYIYNNEYVLTSDPFLLEHCGF